VEIARMMAISIRSGFFFICMQGIIDRAL